MADTDGNGLIDQEEFVEFVEKLDENKTLSDYEIKSEFESHDHDEQKALDQTQFAVCLHAILGKLRKDLEKEEQEDD